MRNVGRRLRRADVIQRVRELLGGGPIAVIPEVLELVLEHPRPVDAPVGVSQAIEESGVARGPMSGVGAEQPPQAFDRLAPRRVERPPLFLPDLVHGLIQRFDEMESGR